MDNPDVFDLVQESVIVHDFEGRITQWNAASRRLYGWTRGPFRIEPDYDKEKVVALTHDVVQTYVPVSVTVAYAGQTPVPKPFLMILEWVKTPQGWRMATDIALPIPPVPHS
jgi:hypothetical protein